MNCLINRMIQAILAIFMLTPTKVLAQSKPHIGIITGDLSGSFDDSLGATYLIKRYGSVTAGGMIHHLYYPNKFMEDQDQYIATVAALADDPTIKAIVVNQAIPGTAEAFKRVHVKRPDIFCVAGEAHEDAPVITATADFVASQDFVSRGYTLVWAAKQLGAKAFVHISFPRHMAYDNLGLRRTIMEAACKELGLKFAYEAAPDPQGPGRKSDWPFLLDKVPTWLKKYGPNGEKVAMFCTCDAHTAPLIRRLLESQNGIFVEADLPSPLMGYPSALKIDVADKADLSGILKEVESAVVAKNGAGRFGTWAFSYGATVTAGLGEFALRVVTGKAQRNNLNDVAAAYGRWTPGARWSVRYHYDPSSGTVYKNMAMVYMDTYVLGGLNGKKFLPTTSLKVPEKYLTMKRK
jgi:hypothetical protein